MSEPLRWVPTEARPELVGPPVLTALDEWPHRSQVQVAEIDPELADTAAFCDRYGVRLEESANCVVVSVRRGEQSRLVACVILASTRADVNGVVRRHLGARKATFASMDTAVAESGMEYGGITPIGLPAGWPLLVDAAVGRLMEGRPFKKEAAIAKLFSSDAAMVNAREATQIFGGYGFMNETPVGRFYRDAKVLEIGEGTSEVQRMLIAREMGLPARP